MTLLSCTSLFPLKRTNKFLATIFINKIQRKCSSVQFRKELYKNKPWEQCIITHGIYQMSLMFGTWLPLSKVKSPVSSSHSHPIPPHATRFIYRSRFPLVCSCSFFFVLFLSSVSDDGWLLQSGSCVSVMGVRGSANKFNGELAHFAPDQGAGWTDRLRGPCGDSPALPFDGFVRCQSPSLLANWLCSCHFWCVSLAISRPTMPLGSS